MTSKSIIQVAGLGNANSLASVQHASAMELS